MLSAAFSFICPPVGAVDSGLSKEQVIKLSNRIFSLYQKDFEARDAEPPFLVYDESDSEFDVRIKFDGLYYSLFFSGGASQAVGANQDIAALFICHEMGHILSDGATGMEVAGEGEADYFATSQCLKRLFADDEDNSPFVQIYEPKLVNEVYRLLSENDADLPEYRDFFARILLAGYSALTVTSKAVGTPVTLGFSTPDTNVVEDTQDDYPSSQCRLDTYVAGVLGWERPACWYRADSK